MGRRNKFVGFIRILTFIILTVVGISKMNPITSQSENTYGYASEKSSYTSGVTVDNQIVTLSENEEMTTEEVTITEETAIAEEIIESVEPEYTVQDLQTVKYANQPSNVRKGPSTKYDRIGSLNTNQEVQVTGQADTGWYRISYNGGVGFVSHTLLVDSPIVIEQPEPEPQPTPQSTGSGNLWDYTEEELIYGIVAAIITPDMDDFQKATAINNYLCLTMTYDDTHKHRSTYDALAYGIGVCQGYANAFTKLMNAAGVPTDYVCGMANNGAETGGHAWNRSLINGVYYYTDVTWNDTPAGNRYLLISYDQMAKDHDEQLINPDNRID